MYWSQEDQEVQYFWRAHIYLDCCPGLIDRWYMPQEAKSHQEKNSVWLELLRTNTWKQSKAALGRPLFLPPATTGSLLVGFCGDGLGW